MSGDRAARTDRRGALKKAAAAGAIAWTAPALIADAASAAPGDGCTPKCKPVGDGRATASATLSCSGAGRNRIIRITFQVRSVIQWTCPCDGSTPTVTRTVSSSQGQASVSADGTRIGVLIFRGSAGILRVALTETATCTDRSGSQCSSACVTAIASTVLLNDQGNCRGAAITQPQVTVRCT